MEMVVSYSGNTWVACSSYISNLLSLHPTLSPLSNLPPPFIPCSSLCKSIQSAIHMCVCVFAYLLTHSSVLHSSVLHSSHTHLHASLSVYISTHHSSKNNSPSSVFLLMLTHSPLSASHNLLVTLTSHSQEKFPVEFSHIP